MSKSPKGTGFPRHVDRNHLPEPEWEFPNAEIGMYATESKPDFPPAKSPPKGSPNILLVLLDDVGFGWPSSNGGLVRMPTAERLAKAGLLYNQFHTTSLCSPTRAALLTGRNHHTVATGVIQEMATGYPGYCGIIPKSCATFAELLKQTGYTSAWFGKNHNVPDNLTSAAGPFDNWPTNQGFGHIDEQIPQRCGTETMDVRMDCVSPVCSDYEKKGLFPFTGKLDSVTFAFGDHEPPNGMEQLKLATAMD